MADYHPLAHRFRDRLTKLPRAQAPTFLVLTARELAFGTTLLLDRLADSSSEWTANSLSVLRGLAALQCHLCQLQLDCVHGDGWDPRVASSLFSLVNLATRESETRDALARALRSPLTGAVECPCCGCFTLHERGGYNICPVCFWEDDKATEFFGQLGSREARGTEPRPSLASARELSALRRLRGAGARVRAPAPGG